MSYTISGIFYEILGRIALIQLTRTKVKSSFSQRTLSIQSITVLEKLDKFHFQYSLHSISPNYQASFLFIFLFYQFFTTFWTNSIFIKCYFRMHWTSIKFHSPRFHLFFCRKTHFLSTFRTFTRIMTCST